MFVRIQNSLFTCPPPKRMRGDPCLGVGNPFQLVVRTSFLLTFMSSLEAHILLYSLIFSYTPTPELSGFQ